MGRGTNEGDQTTGSGVSFVSSSSLCSQVVLILTSGIEEEYGERSVLENKLGARDPDFVTAVAAALTAVGLDELAWPPDVMVLMAPTVAAPAADALAFRSSKRLPAVGPVVRLCPLAPAEEQV